MLYWSPVNAYTTAPIHEKRITSAIVMAQRALGKSFGSRISAMNEGMVIWPMNVYEIFKNAFMPATNETPFTGIAVTVGSPISTVYPAGCSSIPAKIAAKSTEMKVKNADAVPSLERVEKVRGMEKKKQITAEMTEKMTVHMLWLVIVLRYLAEVRTWRPWMKVLLRRNITAVAHQAQSFPQKSIWPMSQTSRTSG